MSELEQPSDTALAAAYQVTARWFASEQQLIWRRTALFVTLNSLVVAAVQFLPAVHPVVRVLVPLAGAVYSVCWYFSLNRAWTYQEFLARMMREQEVALKLGSLGAFTRGKRIIDGGKGEKVAGEDTTFPPRLVMFKAKVMADATTWLFVAVYVVFLLHGASQFKLA